MQLYSVSAQMDQHKLLRVVYAILLGLCSTLTFVHGHNTTDDNQDRFSASLIMRNSAYTYTCTSDGYYGNHKNCSVFHRCEEVKGQMNDSKIFERYDYDCPPGTIFDTKIEKCNHPWIAKPTDGCNILTNSTDEMTMTTTHRPRPQAPPNSKKVHLYNVREKRCLNRVKGRAIQMLAKCDESSKNQDWYVINLGKNKDGRDRVKFTSETGKTCLTAQQGEDDIWTVHNYKCNDNLIQIWIPQKDQSIVLERDGAGCLYHVIRSSRDFICVDTKHCNEKWELQY